MYYTKASHLEERGVRVAEEELMSTLQRALLLRSQFIIIHGDPSENTESLPLPPNKLGIPRRQSCASLAPRPALTSPPHLTPPPGCVIDTRTRYHVSMDNTSTVLGTQ